ncbi:MAG: hypothetical protein ACK5L8_08185 [Marinicella pacifica]
MNKSDSQTQQLRVSTTLSDYPLVQFSYMNQAEKDDTTVILPFEVLSQSPGYREIWQLQAPATYEKQKNRRLIQSDQFLVLIYDSQSSDLSDVVSSVYDDAFQTGSNTGYGHLIRVWNYFPAINDNKAGMENYQRFCVARHALLDRHNQLGRPNPAATAIGTHNQQSCYVFIFSKTPGTVIENIRQVSAWEYPLHYSPKQPRFSRAMQFGNLLMCSGTASVVGHETRHKDDLRLQFKECMRNIAVLLSAANIRTDLTEGLFRFYLRDTDDVDDLKQCIKSAGLKHHVILGGDICREDLLVECEAVFQNN